MRYLFTLCAFAFLIQQSAAAEFTERIFPEERLYQAMVFEASRQNDIDAALVMAVIAQESRFKWYAVSSSGALGLMQIMPGTAASECPDIFAGRDLRTVRPNIQCGTRYLARQLRACSGNLVCALSSYNQGPTLTASAGGKPVTAEAIAYVPKVLRLYGIYGPKVKFNFWTIRNQAGADTSSRVSPVRGSQWTADLPDRNGALKILPSARNPIAPDICHTEWQRPCCKLRASGRGNAAARFCALILRF